LKHWILLIFLGVLWVGCADSTGSDTGAEDTFKYDFTVVSLPDTQRYAQDWPEVFLEQTQWIVDNAVDEKIIFVTQLGDIVNNHADPSQWEVASEAMAILEEASIPYGVAMGNHDAGGTERPWSPEGCRVPPDEICVALEYLNNFGPTRFDDEDWYGGASPTGLSNYQIVEAGGFTLIFIHFVNDPWQAEVDWAQGILDAYPGALVHVSVHRYLHDYRATERMPEPWPLLAADRFNFFSVFFISPLNFRNGLAGDRLFDAFVEPNGNVYMVQCGHVDAEFYQKSINAADLSVYEILVDFQTFSPRGGDGWLRLLRYDIAGGRIRVQTYSPSLNRYRENGEGCGPSVEGLSRFFEKYRDLIAIVADPDVVEAQIEYWSNTEEGFEEFCSLLYDEGQRDSDYIIEVDFDAYRNASL